MTRSRTRSRSREKTDQLRNNEFYCSPVQPVLHKDSLGKLYTKNVPWAYNTRISHTVTLSGAGGSLWDTVLPVLDTVCSCYSFSHIVKKYKKNTNLSTTKNIGSPAGGVYRMTYFLNTFLIPV